MANALVSGAHAPVGELSGRPGAVKLRFCPNSNDLLYPKVGAVVQVDPGVSQLTPRLLSGTFSS